MINTNQAYLVQIFYTERAYRLLREKFWVPLIVLPFM